MRSFKIIISLAVMFFCLPAQATSLKYTDTTALAIAAPIIVSGTCGTAQRVNPPFAAHDISFTVTEVIKGNVPAQIIFRYPGIKPVCNSGDDLVLFLNSSSSIYLTVGYEQGMFKVHENANGIKQMLNSGDLNNGTQPTLEEFTQTLQEVAGL